MKSARATIFAILISTLGCGSDDGGGSSGGITVNPGESIQAAVG
jgi:hypothetical protein